MHLLCSLNSSRSDTPSDDGADSAKEHEIFQQTIMEVGEQVEWGLSLIGDLREKEAESDVLDLRGEAHVYKDIEVEETLKREGDLGQ